MVVAIPATPIYAANVVELFTSQGCYSCPPADKLLGGLVKGKEGVIGLEYHVDYWDELVWGAAGKWKDPFSDPAHTKRQREYNALRLSGRRGVYTPQMIINGDTAIVGSNRDRLFTALRAAPPRDAEVSVTRDSDGHLAVAVDGAKTVRADVWRIDFERQRETAVPRGENHGKRLMNHHIVNQVRRLGTWEGGMARYDAGQAQNDADYGCAIVVQTAPIGSILGARYCP